MRYKTRKKSNRSRDDENKWEEREGNGDKCRKNIKDRKVKERSRREKMGIKASRKLKTVTVK